MSYLRAVALAVAAILLAAFAGAASASEPQAAAQSTEASSIESPRTLGPKDVVLKGDAVCTKCHDEQDNYPILKIGQTKHGTVADGRTPTCTSCHGESATHVNKPADAAERPKPDRLFRKTSPTPVDERNAACLSCHEGGQHILWAGSTHQSRGVACTDCHQVHNGKDKVRDKQTQPEVCFNCHKQQRAQIEKPSHHPIPEGEMACSDCHAPHGSAGPKLMKRDTVNDTCFQCHAEKRGPHLWSHQPVTENCALCHNPHGTTTPNMLKQRAPFLCQECHEPTSHRGGIPSLSGSSGGTSGLGITGGRACLNCHTNIHGGNNPTNNGASRSMRR